MLEGTFFIDIYFTPYFTIEEIEGPILSPPGLALAGYELLPNHSMTLLYCGFLLHDRVQYASGV